MEYHIGTKDSYHEGSNQTITPSGLVEIVKNKFNRYNGGEVNSITANMDYYKKGFIYKKNILIYGSEGEFKEFENLIKDYVEYFTARNFE